MATPVKHVDVNQLMIEMLEKSGNKNYDDKEQSMFFLIAQLIMAIEGIGDKVAKMANESSAFSDMQSITQKVDGDIARIQKWKAAHPNASDMDAMQDPEFKKEVAAFKKDLTEMRNLATKYNMIDKYTKDGMNEVAESNEMIWNDKINWRPDGKNQSIGEMISGGKDDELAAALFHAAGDAVKKPDTSNFKTWTEGGKAGSPSLKTVESDYQSFISGLNQQLNVEGASLQQDHQVGQNFIKSLGSLIDTIIQHLNDHP